MRNPAFRAYAEGYLQIQEEFVEQVRQAGMEFDPEGYEAELAARREALRRKGATFRNNGHSIHAGPISPACLACAKGVGSATFYTSLQCHRHCFYCFNPNQEAYTLHSRLRRDVAAELRELSDQGFQVSHLALTGGEPLLHPQEACTFFATARERFPGVHTRLYTAGDHLNRDLLRQLQEAGLAEIRISVRAHDGPKGRRQTYEKIALAREYIPAVMVETPVLPGTREIMQEMLLELDRLQVFGANLLEFCFPFHNAEAFRSRGYLVKQRPYETLYDYWYAGGLPVSRSELECLELLEFTLDRGLGIGVHYCSLENKHTGQIYQQNWGEPVPSTAWFSPRDFFIRVAKVFGSEKEQARVALGGECLDRGAYLEFHPALIERLKGLDLEVGIAVCVVEHRPEGQVLRELKVGLTRPEAFDPGLDL
ncbi:MAG: radical SAM protein [Bacillota bacterium]